MAGEDTFAAVRELAARFGFLLRRKDQRPASSDVGCAGAVAGGEGVEAGGAEGCKGTGGLVEDTGDVCSKDFAGGVCVAAPELVALFLLRPRRKVGAGERAGEGAGDRAGEGAGDRACEGAGEHKVVVAGACDGAGEDEGAGEDKGVGAGEGWPAEQSSCPVVSEAVRCSAGTWPVAWPSPASQEVSGTGAFAGGPLDGAAISTSVSVTMSSWERPSNVSSSVAEPMDVSAKAGAPAVLLPSLSSAAARAHMMSVS